jgi:alpha-L-rhamnosidase
MPVELRCEHLVNPTGVEDPRPRLSWRLEDPRQGARQTAYRMVAASSPGKLETKPDLWDTGVVPGDTTLDVEYGGRKLRSRQTVYWRVQSWDQDRQPTEWSAPATFEMGLLSPADWTATWIGRPLEGSEGFQPSPFLRRGFDLAAAPVRARLYVTARGVFEAFLNGERVGQDCFTPGWTDYRKRIPYQVYDVTSLLRPGANAIGAILGDGWYAGYLGWGHTRHRDGDQLSLCAQLEIEHADGTRQTIVSDPSWKTSFGPLLRGDFYNGETYDARRELPGWSTAAFNDSAWQPAVAFDAPAAKRVVRRTPPVRRQEELPTAALTEPQFGVHVFDLGQNIVGWARIRVSGAPGDTVTIRYAEMLNADGTLYTANLRAARCTDEYICRGGGEEVYEPRFTFHGFRYVELTGLRAKPAAADVTGVVLHSEIAPTGTFECSDPLINRLQQNIAWGQRGNFLEAPTDCPQRDERLGWTGDAQVFAPTACFNRDVAAFFTKWCIDVEDSQFPDGAYPHVAPDALRDGGRGCAAWSDAGVIVPWTVYLCYGDTRILERQYDSMVRWVGWRIKNSKDLICREAMFGDWLAPDPNTPREAIATAYFARTAELLSRAAAVLGRRADAAKYRKLAARVRAAFNRELVTPSGRIIGDSQTVYLLALAFDLLPPAKRRYALDRLVRDITARQDHLSTGFVGTPLLCPVLSRYGRTDIAYKLLQQRTYPAWLYTVLQGATTMWERWNSFDKEKGFGDASMNSFNHYAYGAIGEWMYSTVAGIALDPAKPGYKHILIRPQPGGGLTSARGELLTRHGRVACAWTLEGRQMKVDVTVPPNTTATVTLPGRPPKRVAAGTYAFSVRRPADATGKP